jgi:hypothetical protein
MKEGRYLSLIGRGGRKDGPLRLELLQLVVHTNPLLNTFSLACRLT